MDLNIKNIDITKADLGIRHTYVPQVKWNLDNPEEDRVSVDCEYFRVGERMRYAVVGADSSASLDFTKVFKEKVKGISGLAINGKAITTADAIVRLPAIPELEALMMDVVLHIISSDSLNKDEEKN